MQRLEIEEATQVLAAGLAILVILVTVSLAIALIWGAVENRRIRKQAERWDEDNRKALRDLGMPH